MATFLLYPDFSRSAAVLDDRRLGKQRVETLQVVRALRAAQAMPPWLGDERVHASHQASLLRKDPAHYRGWHWPTRRGTRVAERQITANRTQIAGQVAYC